MDVKHNEIQIQIITATIYHLKSQLVSPLIKDKEKVIKRLEDEENNLLKMKENHPELFI